MGTNRTSYHGLGRLVLLIFLCAKLLCQGPTRFDLLSWGDVPSQDPSLKPIGDLDQSKVFMRPGGTVKIGKRRLEAQSTLFVFSQSGLHTVMYQLPLHPNHTRLATALQWSKALQQEYGPPIHPVSPEELDQGTNVRWITRKATLSLGKTDDGFFHLLFKAPTKDTKSKSDV